MTKKKISTESTLWSRRAQQERSTYSIDQLWPILANVKPEAPTDNCGDADCSLENKSPHQTPCTTQLIFMPRVEEFCWERYL
jgi:hypothetical protein